MASDSGTKGGGGTRGAFEDSIRDILDDVFHLETNTIICDEITARRMPPTPHALIDIAQAYVGFLERQRVDVSTIVPVTTNPCTFFEIARAAKRILDTPAAVRALANRDRSVVQRIRRSSIHLVFLVRRMASQTGDLEGLEALEALRGKDELPSDQVLELLAQHSKQHIAAGSVWNATRTRLYELGAKGETEPKQLRPQDRTAVRKIWEVRVEHVAMQSVVQLDGDIVTRVQDYYASADCAWLHDLHRQGVGTSIAMWHHLVETLAALATGAASAFAALLRR